MEITLILILFFLAIVIPRSRFIYLIILGYMWALFAFNVYAPDTAQYEWVYNVGRITHYEPLFSGIMVICKSLGFSYVGFRIVIASIIVLILNHSFQRIEHYRALAAAMFLVSPFLWYISGIRAGLACVILIDALIMLADSPKNNKYKYCILLFIATLVHYSSILFIVMLLTKDEIDKRRVFLYVVIGIIGILIVHNSNFLFEFVSVFTNREKILIWLTGGEGKSGYPNWKGFLAELIILVGNIYITIKSKMVILSRCHGRKEQIAKSICEFNLISILFIPFLWINDTYMRLLFVLHGVNLILYSMAAYSIQEKGKQKHVLNIGLRARFSLYVLIVPLWTYVIAFYQNYRYFGTDKSVLSFLVISNYFR